MGCLWHIITVTCNTAASHKKITSSSITLSAVNSELKLMQMLPSDCMIDQRRQPHSRLDSHAVQQSTSPQCNAYHSSHVPVYSSRCLLALAASGPSCSGEHHVSYLLDGFQCGHCGERCGGHFTNVHVHIAAVLADSQNWIFFRNVFSLFDIFSGLFNLRLAVHNRVGHRIQVILILLEAGSKLRSDQR